jgi:nucleotide-binding universal stress UspA family protein
MSELIVVGVDGSAEAAAALDYAATEAAQRGARVRVVTVSQMHAYWEAWTASRVRHGFPPPPPTDFVSMAQQVAQDAVDAFAANHPALAGKVEMEIVGVAGHPAAELVAQSREADLLVVGHRGRGAIASTFLGSVGLSCAQHAHCPVTIVRPAQVAEHVTATSGAAASPAE